MTFDTMDQYEICAIAFYCETGYMAPGKDRPAAMGPPGITDSQLQAKWDHWNKVNGAVIRNLFRAIEEYTE